MIRIVWNPLACRHNRIMIIINDDNDPNLRWEVGRTIMIYILQKITMMSSRQSWAEAKRRNWFRSQEGRYLVTQLNDPWYSYLDFPMDHLHFTIIVQI